MTIEECYNMLGGNLEQMKNRLPSVSLIEKFVAKFPSDGSFADLSIAMQSENRKEAFRAAHTLKGVCANLGFDKLFSSSDRLTELLRPESETISKEAYFAFDQVKNDYGLTLDAIKAFLS